MTATVGEIDLALSRATLYSALALGFRPPEDDTIARLGSRNGAATLAAAAHYLDRGDSGLAAACLRLADHASRPRLDESHARLFGHTARGAVPPYETEYGSEALFQQPQDMGDLMGFYRAFGLAMKANERERPDHVSSECEFFSFLALKEVYALEHDDGGMLEETRNAERLFLRDHLGRFLPAFAKKLTREDGDGFYGSLGAIAGRLMTLESSRFGVVLGPENLSLRPADDGGVPMACGSGDCSALPGVSELDESE